MHILLVDDQSFTRANTKQMLQQLPCVSHVSEAGSGLEAMLAGFTDPPDLLLIDIDMGAMTGLFAVHHFQLFMPALPIIALSQVASRARSAFQAGVDTFLLKEEGSVALIKAVILVHHRLTDATTLMKPTVSSTHCL